MLFGSRKKWWNSPGKRPAPHEGLDICFFRTVSGDIGRLGSKTRVPCPFRARVVGLMNDFIGQTIVFHPLNDGIENLYFFFAHLRPDAGVSEGRCFSRGECFARIAPVADNRDIPAHLHISVAERSVLPADEDLSWPVLNRRATGAFIDPMRVFTFPDYGII